MSQCSSSLDPSQAASAAQFDRQSDAYGKSHILANTQDVENAMEGGKTTWWWPMLTLLARRA
jgi:hypothetical protein